MLHARVGAMEERLPIKLKVSGSNSGRGVHPIKNSAGQKIAGDTLQFGMAVQV